MNGIDILVLLVVVLSAVALRLLVVRGKTRGNVNPSFPSTFSELPGARHYAYFPQVRQALSAADREYLSKTVPHHVARRVLRERRAVARRFLAGLREDFSNLARLGRTIATLSPEVSHRQETERLVLSTKFQLLCALVWLRLFIGMLPLEQLESLAGMVGRLATRIDETMAELNVLSASPLGGKLSA